MYPIHLVGLWHLVFVDVFVCYCSSAPSPAVCISAATSHTAAWSSTKWRYNCAIHITQFVLHCTLLVVNPRRMHRRVTVLGFVCVCVCVCVCLSVCLSVRFPVIPLNKTPKKGHHKNQRPMGKIFKKAFDFKCVILKLRIFPVYTVPKCVHFLTSVSMCKAFSKSMHLRGITG